MEKTIEQRYQELSEIEHVLKRPGMWIGSMVSEETTIPVFEDGHFIDRTIEYVPGLIKLYDEIISNSVDEHKRTRNQKNGLSKINITVTENGVLTCTDNGGIPIEFHKDAGMYVQEMLFGKLRAGSNFDDTEQRETVGQNGVGASLVNVMSKRFSVWSADGKNEAIVEWTNNMNDKSEIQVKKSKRKGTSVVAEIELSRFGIDTLPFGVIKLIERRCIIAAASNPGLEIVFNNETYKFNSFKEYVDMYGLSVVGEKNDDWEFYIGFAEDVKDGNKFYGIVNSAECNMGTHMHHIENITYLRVSDIMTKRHNINDVTKKLVSSHAVYFVNITVGNPTYDSQSKTKLTTDLGYAFYDKENDKKRWPSISKRTTRQLQDSELVQYVVNYYERVQEAKEREELKNKVKDTRKKSIASIEKLVDANASGKKARQECELWLFEGASAGAAFRVSRSPKTQAAYFLRGKVRNTIGMKPLDVMKNQELSDIVKASGLNILDPDDLSNLRYGKFVICTDADVDGASIVGQIVTFFAVHFPKLITEGYVYYSKSPIIKSKKKKDVKYFYSLADYNEFTAKNKGYTHEYFKGLGSLEKEDYRNMLQKPVLEQFTMTADDFTILKAWMGGDSSKRKSMLA